MAHVDTYSDYELHELLFVHMYNTYFLTTNIVEGGFSCAHSALVCLTSYKLDKKHFGRSISNCGLFCRCCMFLDAVFTGYCTIVTVTMNA